MKVMVFVFLILSISLTGIANTASFDEFPIMAWMPWYYGATLSPETPGSIPSLKSIGFNSVYWSTRSNNIDTVAANGMKGYFYPHTTFAELTLSSMNYIFETYTLPDYPDTVDYNPTAWKYKAIDVDEHSDPPPITINGYSIEISEDFTGVILDSLWRRDHDTLSFGSYEYQFWGARAIDPTHRTTGFGQCGKVDVNLDDALGIHDSCRVDEWCSLESLCPSYISRIDTTGEIIDTTFCRKMGYIFYPRIKVASLEGATHDTLCLIGIAEYGSNDSFPVNDNLYEWHAIYWDDFPNADIYYEEPIKFKVGLTKSRLNIRVKTSNSGAPVTFYIDQIRAVDAFNNYLKWKLSQSDTTSLLEKKDINSSKLVQKYNIQYKFRN